jgi:DNA-binding transcriptional regulator LsrR (DeoR family)
MALANVRRARSGRPCISRERLQKVAEIYREHIDDRPTEAVSRTFGISHRTAARYVQQARESGLLPDTTPGKRKA